MKMRNIIAPITLLVVLAAVAHATIVQDCKEGKSLTDTNLVSISNCEKGPCRLRRKHDVEVEAKFTPTHDIKNLRNFVSAQILGIPFPFIGVDGTSACGNIFEEGGEKASCPLQANRPYIYKNSFKVLEIYPKLKTVVRWALTDPKDNHEPLCFNVQVRITS